MYLIKIQIQTNCKKFLTRVRVLRNLSHDWMPLLFNDNKELLFFNLCGYIFKGGLIF